LALDARVRIEPATLGGPERLSIRPYPKELEERVSLGDREVILRPIRPEDEPQHKVFLDSLEPEDVRFRFFGLVRDFPHIQLARFTQIDYDREMAFIASVLEGEEPVTLGVVRAICDSDNARAEFAIVVKSDLKSRGMGRLLMEKIIKYCRERGTGTLVGEVLAENEKMLGLAKKLGFKARRMPDSNAVAVALELNGGTPV
jgi:acetyltransferase